jgi:hypothetical protein
LTPKRYQPGETDVTGGTTGVGGELVPTALYKAANALLSRVKRFCTLKRWGLDVAKRRGEKRAKVALARKLAVNPAPHVDRRHHVPVDQDQDGPRMIAAYHGKADCSAAEVLAGNPFAPAAQTAARLRARSAATNAAMPCKAMWICFDHGG